MKSKNELGRAWTDGRVHAEHQLLQRAVTALCEALQQDDAVDRSCGGVPLKASRRSNGFRQPDGSNGSTLSHVVICQRQAPPLLHAKRDHR